MGDRGAVGAEDFQFGGVCGIPVLGIVELADEAVGEVDESGVIDLVVAVYETGLALFLDVPDGNVVSLDETDRPAVGLDLWLARTLAHAAAFDRPRFGRKRRPDAHSVEA